MANYGSHLLNNHLINANHNELYLGPQMITPAIKALRLIHFFFTLAASTAIRMNLSAPLGRLLKSKISELI